MYKSILLAADGSQNSIRAGKQAAQLASLVKGVEVTIVYVSDFDEDSNEEVHDGGPIEFELARKRKIQPIRDNFEREKVYYKTEVLHGRPAPAIIELAHERNFDLVVIGSRGLNPLSEMMLGSVSHKVVNGVNCPVLVVK